MPAGIAGTIAGFLGPAGIGIGASTAGIIGDIGASAIIGAGVGTVGSAITGGHLGKGALFGGITGGFLGGAGPLAEGLGLSGLGADAVTVAAGAGGGALGGLATGMDPGKGAILGGISGGIQAALTPGATPLGKGASSPSALSPSGTAPSVGGAAGGSPAAATAAAGTPIDLTGLETINVAGVPSGVTGAGGAFGAAASPIDLSGLGNINVKGVPTGFTGQLPSASGGFTTSDLGPAPTHDALSTPVVGDRGIGGIQGGASGASGAGSAGAGGGPTSLDKFFEHPSLKSAGSVLTSNPASVLAAGGLAYEALSQPSLPDTSQITKSLQGTADQLASSGSILTNYINNGTLPPGAMSAINNASAAAKATLRSQFAGMGMTGSTAEATALAGVDERVSAQIFETANSLLQTGLKETGLSADIYQQILGQTNSQNEQMRSSIAAFAAALAGGSPTFKLNVGGSGA